MAVSTEEIKNRYPLPAYNFRVRLGPDNYSFSQVSGLTLRYDPVTYRHGLSWLEGELQRPGMQQAISVTLQKGIVPAGSVLLEWVESIRLGTVTKQDIIIDLCDETGAPRVSWTVQNAFPTQLSAPTFAANGNDVALEELTLSANGLRIEYHD